MNWFDISILFIAVLSVIRGFISGFVKQVASLLGIIGGLLFAGRIAVKINPHLQKLMADTPAYAVEAISYTAAFFAVLIIFVLIGLVVQKMVKLLQLGIVDHIAGSFFCLLKWLVAVSILVNVILVFDTKQRIIDPGVKEKSLTYPYIKSIASYFMPFLHLDKSGQG